MSTLKVLLLLSDSNYIEIIIHFLDDIETQNVHPEMCLTVSRLWQDALTKYRYDKIVLKQDDCLSANSCTVLNYPETSQSY